MNSKLSGLFVATLLGGTALVPAAMAQDNPCEDLQSAVDQHQSEMEQGWVDQARSAIEAGEAEACGTLVKEAQSMSGVGAGGAAAGDAGGASPDSPGATGGDASMQEPNAQSGSAGGSGDQGAQAPEPGIVPEAAGAETGAEVGAEGTPSEGQVIIEGGSAPGAAEPVEVEPAGAEGAEPTVTQGEAEPADADAAVIEGEAEPIGEAEVEAMEGEADPALAEGAPAGTLGTPAMPTWRTGRDPLLAPQMEREGFAATEPSTLSLEDLQGATVFGSEDQTIANIDDVVAGADGTIEYFIMDVGGFLGLGSREVAVGFDEVTVLQEEGGGAYRVYVDATEEQLEQLPQYEGEEAAAQ